MLQASSRSLVIFSDNLLLVAVKFIPRIYSVDGLLHRRNFLHVVFIFSLLVSGVQRILSVCRVLWLRPRLVPHHELLSVALLDLCLLLIDVEVSVRVVNSLPLLLSLLVLNEHLLC